MSRLTFGWLTDIHLDHLTVKVSVRDIGNYFKEELPDSQFLIISGDISQKRFLEKSLQELLESYGKPIYFVLGNHDFWGSSFRQTAKLAKSLPGWLDAAGVVSLSPEVGLIGNTCWYDAYYGDCHKEGLNDFWNIKELRKPQRRESRTRIIGLSREVSLKHSRDTRVNLEASLTKHDLTILVIHVPPYVGEFQDGMVGWYTSKLMGDTLLEVMGKHPDKKLLVLCGHRHIHEVYRPLPNLQVITGMAEYGVPALAGVFETYFENISGKVKTSNGWVNLPILV